MPKAKPQGQSVLKAEPIGRSVLKAQAKPERAERREAPC